MEQSEDTSKGKLKMWSAEEDKVLVECLVVLKTEQKFMADNGFKPGYANALQIMMEGKLPGCGIKAVPHINSRIKTLKRQWQIVYDMVYGTNTSGFGWDPDTKVVTAEKDVWDEYVKVHSKAGQFRTRSFPHFDNLSYVWAKDRAVGDEGRAAGVMEEEINLEDDDTANSVKHVEEVELSQAFHVYGTNDVSQAYHGNGTNDVSSSSRKRRRTNQSELLADVLRETVTSLDKTIVTVFENLGNRISRQGRQAALDAKGSDLFIDLLDVPGLSIEQLSAAHIKIVASESLLNAFEKIPAPFKPAWIRSLLQN